MECPSRALSLCPSPPPPPPSSRSRRLRSSSDSSASPEFEFWNIGRNPEPTTDALHSADELFSDGVLLPLHLLQSSRFESDELECEPDVVWNEPVLCLEPVPEPGLILGSSEPSAHITSEACSNGSNPILSASRRWREIFKRRNNNSNNININNTNNSKNNNLEENKVEKLGKKSKKGKKGGSNSGIGTGSGNNNSIAAELNINIWPFARSRSAGNNSNQSNKPASSNREVSSAPCSRSNSSGESKSSTKSWPSSPGRAGVHLGRASPVWQGKRSSGPGNRAGGGAVAGKGRVLKLNVPVCIGYRQHLSCRSDENGSVVGGGLSGGGEMKTGGGNGSGGNGNLFGFRGLFSKKSSATVLTV